MAYRLYLDGVLFPVTPSKIVMKINGKNERVTLINEGEANILKTPGLTDVDLELLLPNASYPFAAYPEEFRPAEYYLGKLEELMLAKLPFQFIMTRLVGSKKLFDNNMTVSLEDYSIEENAKEGLDITVKVKLKQYREYRTKTCTVDISMLKPRASVSNSRGVSSNAPSVGSYTVIKGDCLSRIARRYYGNGTKWPVIYDANKNVIGGNPNLIYPGQVLTIPPS